LLAGGAPAQNAGPKKITHEGAEALQLSNGKIDLTVLTTGGAFADLHLTGDTLNALWDPVRMGRTAGVNANFGPSRGHFLCVDGFGPVSREEAAAGLSGHGEAYKLPWEVTSSSKSQISFRVRLPLVQEVLTRRVTIAAGEQVALVESSLTSELPFDRVMLWAEHATIGAPFLKLGKTIVDASSTRCQTKPYQAKGPRTFPGSVDFDWPSVPMDGGLVNARVSPEKDATMNHIGCLMDPARPFEFITALDTESNLMLGYLFPRSDYPWVQHWMNYPANKTYSWGVEFGMQPYDMTKQELVGLTPLFNTPTFRWLPAKSTVSTRFAMFLTKVPAAMRRVDDVRYEGGKIVIEDRQASQRVSLDFANPHP
jgi:hypothetical protein